MSGFIINPMQTTNASGLFKLITTGYIQGHAYNEPATQFQFDTGPLASTETNPMWGGVALTLGVSGAQSSGTDGAGNSYTIPAPSMFGDTVKRASAVSGSTGINAFSIYNQNYSSVITAQSNAPLSLPGQSINYARIGSGVKVALGIDPAFAATLQGGVPNPQFSWDFQGQQIVPYQAAQSSVTISTIAWASNTLTITLAADAPNLSVGSWFTIAGNVQSGGTLTTLNGTYKVATINHSTFVITVTSTNTNPFNPISGSIGTTTTAGSVSAVGGALGVNLVDVVTSNSLIVDYNYPTQSGQTGNANFVPGAIAIVIL